MIKMEDNKTVADESVIGKVQKIKEGKLSTFESINVQLEKIKGDKFNIFLTINENALSEAQMIDGKISEGKKVGKLAGLGIAVKANINVKGLPISCASKVLENYLGAYDADVIRMIKEEDGIILGIVNCDEFACGSTGRKSAFGPTINPSSPERVPGGSSSGSAAAVAAGMCDIALGSDTGGSIRCPASHCGVYGIKPSYGRVSRYGLADLSMSFDQIGPLSGDVEGCALMMEVISGYSFRDPMTFEKKVDDYSDACSDACSKEGPKEKRRLRMGIVKEFKELCSDERIWSSVEEAAKSMGDDVEIVEVSLENVKLAVQAYYPIVYVEFFSATRKFDGRRYGLKFEDYAGMEPLRRALGGSEISKAEFEGRYYRKALQVKELIRNSFEKAFEEVDVLITPVMPILPPKIGKDLSVEEEYSSDAFTIPANLAGICGGVIPWKKIEDANVGIQILAKAFDEKCLIGLMKRLAISRQRD